MTQMSTTPPHIYPSVSTATAGIREVGPGHQPVCAGVSGEKYLVAVVEGSDGSGLRVSCDQSDNVEMRRLNTQKPSRPVRSGQKKKLPLSLHERRALHAAPLSREALERIPGQTSRSIPVEQN